MRELITAMRTVATIMGVGAMPARAVPPFELSLQVPASF